MEDLFENILKIFSKNDLFDEGVELIGSWCFYLYQKKLGVETFPLRTMDIDFLIPNPFKGKDHKDFIDDLKGLGFEIGFRPDGSLYLWSADFKIEFITQEKGSGSDKAIKVKKLGLSAIPLRYMNILFEEPIVIKLKGVKVLVPDPKNFCLHKLIVASQRRKIDKKLKDLKQAICVFKVLDKSELRLGFDDLPKGWRNKVVKVIAKYKKELPLYMDDFDDLVFTLQGRE